MLKALQLWFDKKFPEPAIEALADRELRAAQRDLLVAEHQQEYHSVEAEMAQTEATMLRCRIERLKEYSDSNVAISGDAMFLSKITFD